MCAEAYADASRLAFRALLLLHEQVRGFDELAEELTKVAAVEQTVGGFIDGLFGLFKQRIDAIF